MAKYGFGAGHGGNDPGAVSQGNVERDIARIVNSTMVSRGKARGGTIYNLTVDKGYPYNINEPVAMANANGVKFAVQNHFNAGGGTGVEVWYYQGDAVGAAMAAKMSAAIAAYYGLPNRGAKATTYFGFICNTNMTAFIIEWGFVDAPGNRDCSKIMADVEGGVNACLTAMGFGGATSGATATPSAPSASTSGKSITDVAKDVIAGKYGNGNERAAKLAAAGYSYSTVQAKVNELLGVSSSAPSPVISNNVNLDAVAADVYAGSYGNGAERAARLAAAGYDAAAVQTRVNELYYGISSGSAPVSSGKSVDTLAREVWEGKWGNGSERQQRLTAAGYNYQAVQNRVNQLYG